MIELLKNHHAALAELCRAYEVRQLELFGSAARGEFASGRSDLDFLIAYKPPGAVNPIDRYFGLLAALEQLFGPKVDLVDVSAHTNPYFMSEALKHRQVLFAA